MVGIFLRLYYIEILGVFNFIIAESNNIVLKLETFTKLYITVILKHLVMNFKKFVRDLTILLVVNTFAKISIPRLQHDP